MPDVIIDSRFHGPPRSANGGYGCGAVAALADVSVTISLRVPPPLERAMDARVEDDGRVRVHDGDTLVAEAVPAEPVDVEVPAVVGLEAARVASEHFVGAPVRVGEPYVVLGWTTAPAEGRKRHGGSAVLDVDGRPVAVARSMWVTLSAEALAALLASA